MTQQQAGSVVKALAAKSDCLSFIFKTYVVEERPDSHKLPSDLHVGPKACAHPHIHTIKSMNENKFKSVLYNFAFYVLSQSTSCFINIVFKLH